MSLGDTRQMCSDPFYGSDHQQWIHRVVRFEHSDLELRAVGVESLHHRFAHRLDDEMDMPSLALGMRPETGVDLPRWFARL